MSRFWSEVVHGLTPYVPGEQPRIEGLIKLNTNECPYPPSDKVLQAIAAQTTGDLRLYPDPQAAGLKAAIAQHHGLKSEQVFVGNGSDEVLAHAFMALLRHPAPLLHPDISYSFYPVYARLYGIETRELALRADFSIAVDDYLQAGPNGGIIFPNPNAPTGMALPLSEIERLLAGNRDAVVVVDEAYVDFGAQTAATLIDRHPQLLVIRTLSKAWALAGLRVGYALGHPDLIDALTRVKDSFNSYPLDRLALAGATAAMTDAAWLAQTCARIQSSRDALSKGLRERGFDVLPSQANFVFARHPAHEGARLAAQLREHRILVRQFARPQRIADFLRITVGTPQQCEALLRAYDTIAEQTPAPR